MFGWLIPRRIQGHADKSAQVADDLKKADRAERLELYKLMVEMADRVSQRRQAVNSFYLSINTLLVGGSAYLGTTTASIRTTIMVSLAGILVCVYWMKAIESHRTLNDAKFSIINEIENSLVIRPFTDEWARLGSDKDGKRHKPFYQSERFIPRIFGGMYVFQAAWLLPWAGFWQWLVAKAC